MKLYSDPKEKTRFRSRWYKRKSKRNFTKGLSRFLLFTIRATSSSRLLIFYIDLENKFTDTRSPVSWEWHATRLLAEENHGAQRTCNIIFSSSANSHSGIFRFDFSYCIRFSSRASSVLAFWFLVSRSPGKYNRVQGTRCPPRNFNATILPRKCPPGFWLVDIHIPTPGNRSRFFGFVFSKTSN